MSGRANVLRRSVLAVVVSGCSVLGGLVFTGAPALAGTGFASLSSFGPPAGFAGLVGLGVDDSVGLSKGDVYVVDQGHSAVDQFSAAGVLSHEVVVAGEPSLYQLSVDSDPGPREGDVYVAGLASGVVYRFSAGLGTEEEVIKGLVQPTDVAVDEAGDMFVSVFDGNAEEAKVLEFNAAGEPIDAAKALSASNAVVEGLNGPQALAVDPTGADIYVATGLGTLKYTLSGGAYKAAASPFDAAGALGVSVASSGKVLVDRGAEVAELEASGGAPLATFGAGVLSGAAFGLGVNAESGDVYVADDGANVVDVFEEGATPEAPVTKAASGIGAMAATLNGELAGGTTGYHFAYNAGGSCEGGSTTAPGTASSGEVHADIGELTPHTQYTVCLVATNKYGSTVGPGVAFETLSLPVIESTETTGLAETAATLGASVNPEGVAVSECEFEVGPDTSYGQTVPCEQTLSGSAPQSVTAKLTGLAGGSVFHYRLKVVSANGTVFSQDTEFASLGARLGAEFFTQVSDRSATLNADVDPAGVETSYFFEYGTSAAYGSQTVVKSAGSGEVVVGGSAGLEGLTPGTEYHFRVVVKSANGTTVVGTDMSFKTLTAGITTLPDGRVYEMVTPVNNLDANVYIPRALGSGLPLSQGTPTRFPFQVATNGLSVTYQADPTSGGFGAAGNGLGNEYLAKRGGAGGWSHIVIQPPARRQNFYVGFSSDLSVGVLTSGVSIEPEVPPIATGAPGEGYSVLYACSESETACSIPGESAPQNAYQAFFTKKPKRGVEQFGTHEVNPGVNNERMPVFTGGSLGFGDLLFEANDALLPGEGALAKELNSDVEQEIVDGENNNYLYDSVEGRLELVNISPGGKITKGATFGSQPFSAPKVNPPAFSGVISGNGRRVYWSDGAGDVFERVDGVETVGVSAGPARYWTSVDDGRYAFYTEGGMLYRFDAENPSGHGSSLSAGKVLGVIGAGEDGESVYFVSSEALGGTSGEGGTPRVGEPNLYLLQHQETGWAPPAFIATLSEEDGSGVLPFRLALNANIGEFGDWQPGFARRTARVTAGGGAVAFMSDQRLPVVGFPAGFPNNGFDEVYVFEAGVNRLFCVSCSSSGEQPGSAEEGAAGFLPISWSDTYLPQWVADEGSRVFFDTALPLVPQDTNGAQDVYEWEREGAGSCISATAVNGGCIYLLSGGTSRADSWFIGASVNGDSVFIATRAQLTPEDQNDAFDLYDAQVGGTSPVTPPACTGTGCQGVPAPPPTFATPPSVTFAGVGNFAPPAPEKSTPRLLTRAQKLAQALKACRKQKQGKKRSSCEAQARKRYGAKKKAVKRKAVGKRDKSGKSVRLRVEGSKHV